MLKHTEPLNEPWVKRVQATMNICSNALFQDLIIVPVFVAYLTPLADWGACLEEKTLFIQRDIRKNQPYTMQDEENQFISFPMKGDLYF